MKDYYSDLVNRFSVNRSETRLKFRYFARKIIWNTRTFLLEQLNGDLCLEFLFNFIKLRTN